MPAGDDAPYGAAYAFSHRAPLAPNNGAQIPHTAAPSGLEQMDMERTSPPIDSQALWRLLKPHRAKMRMALRVCAHCAMCAESCFLYVAHDRQPEYMPSHKFIHTIGWLYRRKGRVQRAELETMAHIAWRRCVLCTRCYCPLGLDIPEMIALARRICRYQDVVADFANETQWNAHSHGQSHTQTSE